MKFLACVRGMRWPRSRLGFALFLMVCWMLGWTALRLVLKFSFASGGGPGEFAAILAGGFVRDLLAALWYLVPLLLYMLLVPEKLWSNRWHRGLFWSGVFISMFAFLFTLVVEYYFFEEFKSRFNTVAVDYLIYPHEVFVNIWESYHTGLVILACLGVAALWLWSAARWFSPMWEIPAPPRCRLAAFGLCITIALALGMGIGIGAPRISSNRTLNEISNDGPLSFVTALWTHNLDYQAFYQTVQKDEAYQRVRRMLAGPNTRFTEEGNSIRRRIDGDPERPKLNVVVILEESFGSSFWGSLGATNKLTPQMDRLAAQEGLLFSNVYASGNRTVRGMEGVLSSFPPLPGDSIVKRHLTDNVETLARVLGRDGYTNLFLYGGRGVFDSMRSYAVRNGYHRFVEQHDFKNPVFSTVWGVSDEDLFGRGIQEFRALARTKQPFFATMLTVSNHKPYTFPSGRIPNAQGRRSSAVKYADYALGKFFEQARKEDFWTNTVFVVVADHGARVYGKQTIPIHSYEIPFLVVGPAVVKESARIETLGCSLDVGPTILGLIHRPYETLFFGRDLLAEWNEPGRVFLNHNRDIGMMSQNRMVVLGLMQNREFYEGNPKKAEMTPMDGSPLQADLEMARDCMAFYEVADDLYMHQRFALDADLSRTLAARRPSTQH